MAAVNGDSDLASDSFGGLGKRKRTTSQDEEDTETDSSRFNNEDVQQSVEGVLKLLRNYDPPSSLLKYPLSAISVQEPDTKRARLVKNTAAVETIESRVTAGAYTSLDEMVEDVEQAASSLLDGDLGLGEQVNGESNSHPVLDAKARVQIAAIKDLVKKQLYQQKQSFTIKKEMTKDNMITDLNLLEGESKNRPQVLSLRASTEKGPRQVYSGLQHRARAKALLSAEDEQCAYHEIDGRTLPNGFELAEASFLDDHTKRKSPQTDRTFGDVFRPHSRLKPLEMPRPSRQSAQNTPLRFIDSATNLFQRAVPAYKADYKFERLPTSEWLHYTESEASQKKRRNESFKNLSKSADGEQANISNLFYTSYSSFAPTQDNSAAVISERERSQFWWDRWGEQRFRRLFSWQYQNEEDGAVLANSSEIDLQEDFSSFVPDFVPEKPLANFVEGESHETELTDSNSLLAEVSDLLATLSSYQSIRSMSVPKLGNSETSPSSAEFNVYEMLKSQLTLLIESLPPFAVAKLDGGQLEELNISTKLVLDAVDYPGSGEVDDYTMQRRKAAAAAASAAARTATSATPATARPTNYQSPSAAAAAAANYNPRARTYNSGAPPPNLATYGSANSNSQSFQTPRPPATTPRPSYPQHGYQPPGTPSYQQPSVQQFQRPPLQNGYSSYGASAPSQVSYLQRPNQPGYQQRTQENVGSHNSNMRSASPQKSVVNGHQYPQQSGQSPYPQQQAPGSLANTMHVANLDQRTRVEQVRAQQAHTQSPQPQPQPQRQSSGGISNPQTPGGAHRNSNGSAHYDGTDDGRAIPGTSAGEAGRDRSASATAVSVSAQ